MRTDFELVIDGDKRIDGWVDGASFRTVSTESGTSVDGPSVGLLPVLLGALGLPTQESTEACWTEPTAVSEADLADLRMAVVTVNWRRDGVEDGMSIVVGAGRTARIADVTADGSAIVQDVPLRDVWVRLSGLFS